MRLASHACCGWGGWKQTIQRGITKHTPFIYHQVDTLRNGPSVQRSAGPAAAPAAAPFTASETSLTSTAPNTAQRQMAKWKGRTGNPCGMTALASRFPTGLAPHQDADLAGLGDQMGAPTEPPFTSHTKYFHVISHPRKRQGSTWPGAAADPASARVFLTSLS